MRHFIALAIAAAAWAPGAFAKKQPIDVKPVSKSGIIYSYVSFELADGCPIAFPRCGMTVSLQAVKRESHKVIWKTELYRKMFNAKFEIPEQMVFPRSLEFTTKGKLELIDEYSSSYLVDPKDGTLLSPKAAKIYGE